MREFRSVLLMSFFFFFSLNAFTQEKDTSHLKAVYDRALDFNSSLADSVLYYAQYIEKEAAKLGFDKGAVLSLRLKGIYQELREEYDSAIDYYYQALEQSRLLNTLEYESSALSDLATLYAKINQPQRSLDFFKEAFAVSLKRKEIYSIFTNGSNLGSIYTRLGYPDSALFFLGQAEQIAIENNLTGELHSIYNNIGNAWFYKKQWSKALHYFRLNYNNNIAADDKDLLWYDCLNIADVYIENKNFDSARKYVDLSAELAKALGSKHKEADVDILYSKYYAASGDYESAYKYFKSWRRLDTALVNQRTLETIARMQEKYNVKQKEQQNQMLELTIGRQRLEKRNILFFALGIGALAITALVSLFLIRRKNRLLKKQNELIQRQNNKLAKFNAEKNSLISIVSHDLNAPFTSIKMWSHILLSDISNFTEDQKRALYRIQSSADNGEILIRDMLYIEKEEIRHQALNLEEVDMNAFLEDIVTTYQPQAQQKEIRLHYTSGEQPLLFISNRYILSRICENLLSNAIKFTPRGKNIWLKVLETPDHISITVKDEGVGIAREDIPYLFSKYRKISSMPTEGEYSTGLGLSIVKRLVDELNGKIECNSEPEQGSTFTVTLPK
ncbi:MAG: tetratricopeptide repeat-containing sensor histidine kinase [Chitinophagaceae bacterium]|nr:tetratricopeptide repeat-containing sensor histidine kinase [Chitinophagaceae bacterium]